MHLTVDLVVRGGGGDDGLTWWFKMDEDGSTSMFNMDEGGSTGKWDGLTLHWRHLLWVGV